jgi:Putative restriction endonuclease
VKLPIYARAALPAFWLVNLSERRIESFSEPRNGGYRKRIDFDAADDIPVVLGDAEVCRLSVGEVLLQHGDS